MNGKEKTLKKEQQFNIINFENKEDPSIKLDYKEKLKAENKSNRSVVPFNIISNKPIIGKEKEYQLLDSKEAIIPETKIVREFDIVSNKYVENHEDRANSDYQKFKQTCEGKYWKTHNF